MSAAFTPGPWSLRTLSDDLDFDFEVTRPGDELPVAAAYQWGRGVSEANARLIAAAPDLYRVLANAVAQYDAIKGGPIIGALEAARAILAKARGESGSAQNSIGDHQ